MASINLFIEGIKIIRIDILPLYATFSNEGTVLREKTLLSNKEIPQILELSNEVLQMKVAGRQSLIN